MAARPCTVILTDPTGVRHSVDVTAESLFEAAALGLAAMNAEGWANTDAPAATLEISVVQPVVKHAVSVQQVVRWLEGVTTSPKEAAKKKHLKGLLGR